MKRVLILMAFAGLLAACHRGENRGATGTESGTYQGGTYQGTTGSEGWSGSVTNTNTVVTPSEPSKGGVGAQPQTGPSGTGTDQGMNSDQNQPTDQGQSDGQESEPETGTDNGMNTPAPDTGE